MERDWADEDDWISAPASTALCLIPAKLSHMAGRSQRGQLSLNKHHDFLLTAHKALKQSLVPPSGVIWGKRQREGSRQNTSLPLSRQP